MLVIPPTCSLGPVERHKGPRDRRLSDGDNYLLDSPEPGTCTLFCALHPDMRAAAAVG